MRRANLGVVVILILQHLACTGLYSIGDGYLRIEGQVYEWTEAPVGSRSSVLIDSPSALRQSGLQPVEGCDVMVEPWSPKKRPKPATADLWTRSGKTDLSGLFAVGGTTKPGRYDATLTIHCKGFPEIEHVFRHDRHRHDAVVILVRDNVADLQTSAPLEPSIARLQES